MLRRTMLARRRRPWVVALLAFTAVAILVVAALSLGRGPDDTTPAADTHEIVLSDTSIRVVVPVRYDLLDESYLFGMHSFLLGDRGTIVGRGADPDEWMIWVHDQGVGGTFGLNTSPDEILSQIRQGDQRAKIEIIDARVRTWAGSSGAVIKSRSPSYANPPWIGHEAYLTLADGRSLGIFAQIDPAVVPEKQQDSDFEGMLLSVAN